MSEHFSIEEDDPSAQLSATLCESVTAALSTRRPLLTHCNADTTWLLSIPRPHNSGSPKLYFHILIDPWLRGSQSDVAKFFSQQWHKEQSIFQTIHDIEEAIKGIEDAARGEGSSEEGLGDSEEQCCIDAIIISHEFTDHMHKETLLEVSPNVPVFATAKAASAIRSWRHFSFVDDIPRFTGDWKADPVPRIPGWVSIHRLAYAGQDLLYYHSAIMIAFRPRHHIAPINSEAECVIYTPHGITPRDIETMVSASPKIETLALLHGLQDISLPKAQLNLGAHNGLKIQRLLGTKYWVSTHDEVKTGGGLVSWFLNRKVVTLEEAIQREKSESGSDLLGTALESMADVRFVELGNGETMILE